MEKFKVCGIYSEVLVNDNKLIFKSRTSNEETNKSFNINNLKESKIYEIYRKGNTMDAFIKKDDNIIFLYIRNIGDSSNDRIYFVNYDLKTKSFIPMNLNNLYSKIDTKIFRNIK